MNNDVEMRLWNAYDNYRAGRIDAVVNSLRITVNKILENDKNLEKDIFWKKLAINAFENIVLNNFYKGNGVTLSDIYEIIVSKEEIIKNINEANSNFKNELLINKIDEISEKMAETVKDILQNNIFNYYIYNSKFYYCYFTGTQMPSRREWYSLNVFDDIIIINEKTMINEGITVIKNKELIENQKKYIENNIEIIKELSNKRISAIKSSNRKHIHVTLNGNNYYINMLIPDIELEFKTECKKIIDDSFKNLNLQ